MPIRERKCKFGTVFDITVNDGYKLDVHGNKVQNRKYKTFKPPKDMSIRKARGIAREMELEMLRQFERKENLGSEKQLIEVWHWYKDYYAPNRLRESTIDLITQIMENKVIPDLGFIKIGDFTTARITQFLNEVAVIKDKETGRPLRPKQYYKDSYVRAIHSTLSRIFQVAISQGWIKENPCEHAIRPKKNKTEKKPPLELHQIKDIIKKTTEFTVLNAILQFQIYTGMRIGETLALTWDDVNFKNRTIKVNKTVNIINGNIYVGPPKTDNGFRTLYISDTLMSLLKLVKDDQDEKKTALRNVYEDHNLVFAGNTGNYINRHTVSARLASIKKGTDYEYITVHFLRHTNATLLLMNDVDLKTVSAHLGHSDINITADTYTDVLHARQKFVADLVELNLEDENDE